MAPSPRGLGPANMARWSIMMIEMAASLATATCHAADNQLQERTV